MIGIIVRFLLYVLRDLFGSEAKSPQRKRKRRTQKTPQKKGRLLVNKAEAIDGDTIRGIVRGEQVKIRLLLVDTPETNHPRLGKQPYGEEAKQFTAHRLKIAKKVEVELHGQTKDRYGRLVGHVFVSGQNLNRLLLKKGYARFAYRYSQYAYEDVYRAAEADAKAKRLGIWSVRGYVQADGFHPEAVKDWTG